MHKNLIKLLYKFQKEIIEKTAQRLHRSGCKHYRLMTPSDIYPKIEELFKSFLASIEDNSINLFLNTAEGIGIIGFKEGYGLEELESELNNLAESLWEIVWSNLENKYIPKAMESVNKRFFQAKDKLALIYIEQCLNTEEKLLHLKKEFEDFLKIKDIK